MSVIVRVLLLAVIVVLGVTAVFPQWMDFAHQANSDRIAATEGLSHPQSHRPPPKEPSIKLFGSIDQKARYTVTVTYYTTNESFICTKSSFDGRAPLSKTFDFEPVIGDGQHQIEVPLDTVDGETNCRWQPRYLDTCLQRNGDEVSQHCITLFDAKPNTAMHDRMGRMLPGQEMDGGTINIECGPFDEYTSSTPPCYMPIPYDESFQRPAILIENRYALTTGQNVQVNFDFLTIEQARERDETLQMVSDLRTKKYEKDKRQFEENKRMQEEQLRKRREAQRARNLEG